MTTSYPLRFYRCNNIIHYKHKSTLSLTSALDDDDDDDDDDDNNNNNNNNVY